MTTAFFTRPQGRLAYEEHGPADGRLVICAHGAGDNRATYRFLAPALADAGLRVITVDLRGMGESSVDWDRYGAVATADDLAGLIDHLGGPAIVVGHSFAAGAAAHLAANRPGLVSGVIMLGAVVEHPPQPALMRLAAKIVTGSPTLWTLYYRSLFPKVTPPDLAEHRRHLRRNLRSDGRIRTLRALIDSFDVDPDPDLNAITVPTLVIMGALDGDIADPAAEAERIGAEVNGEAVVTVLPRSGHYPHQDDPEATCRAIVQFVAGV